jgi:glycosyltransferase involved in cell wall biosynthesis
MIARCLTAITTGAYPGEVEIIVVANGCSDRTAEIAQSFGNTIQVINSPIPLKSNALNLGDNAASGFPRFFVDADIVMPIDSIRRVAKRLEVNDVLAAAPRMHVDYSDRSRAIRAFYRVWTRLPYFQSQMIGSGVYALSRSGRARFDHFPDIIADDGFIRLLFRPGERVCVDDCIFILTPPKDIISLIKIKTRAHYGNYELARRFPELVVNEGRSRGSALATILCSPDLWLALPLYCFVMAIAKLRAHWRVWFGGAKWDRDKSSRITGPKI